MEIIITVGMLMVQAALVTFVMMRAQGSRAVWFFLGVTVLFAILNSQALFPLVFTTPEQIYTGRAVVAICLGLFDVMLMWLLSQIFMPQWWKGRRPIIFISLPYLLIITALTLDLTGRYGWFVAGLDAEAGIALRLTNQGGIILRSAFTGSWLILIMMLIVAFVRQPQSRQPLLILLASLIFSMVVTQLDIQLELFSPAFLRILTAFPMLLALAYILLRTSLLVPTRAALDLALHGLSDLVVVLDNQGSVVYANEQAEQFGLHLDQAFVPQMHQLQGDMQHTQQLVDAVAQHRPEELLFAIGTQRLQMTVTPVFTQDGKQRGTLLMGRDVTLLEQRTTDLEYRTQEQQKLLDLVATLETPTIQLADGVMMAPIMGYVNGERAQALMNHLLKTAAAHHARTVILDVTGVAQFEDAVTHLLMEVARALQLLGCTVLMSGISAEMALTLAKQDITLPGIGIVRNVQEALRVLQSTVHPSHPPTQFNGQTVHNLPNRTLSRGIMSSGALHSARRLAEEHTAGT